MKKRLATGSLCTLLALSMSISALASPVDTLPEAEIVSMEETDIGGDSATGSGSEISDEATSDETAADVVTTDDESAGAAAQESNETEAHSENETATENESVNDSESESVDVSESESESKDVSESDSAEESESISPEDLDDETEDADEEVEEPIDQEAAALTEEFVKRLYETLLLRSPDKAGLENWTTQLMTKQKTGAEIVYGFINSTEFLSKNYSNEQFLQLLYKAMFNRGADPTGLNTWTERLNEYYSRNYVLAGFVGSQEFINLCKKFEIEPGKIVLTDVLDTNVQTTRFVRYLYKLILGREPDKTGLRNWVTKLSDKSMSAAQVVEGFIYSQEFIKKNYSDSDYVTLLYNAILSRSPDAPGLSNWCEYLEYGLSRKYVLRGFIESSEFAKLCASYGIEAGTITLTENRDQNAKHTKYVYLAYKNMLSRTPAASELNEWTGKLNDNSLFAQELLEQFIFSTEADVFSLSYSEYAQYLYQAVLHRAPSSSEADAVVNSLTGDGTRRELFASLLSNSEFSDLVESYDLEVRFYQNPAGYYQINNTTATLTGGGYELGIGYEGLKVARVIEYLGVNGGRYVGMSTKAEYTYAVYNAVRRFQERNGLKVDGIVGINTWRAMGFSDYDWYNLGAYVTPCKTTNLSTRLDHIEAMISTAYSYLGTDYVVGASGKPGEGVDCSGLVMQCLYAAGIDTSPINPVSHSQPGHEYESRNMWRSDQFLHVNYSERERGDLIFYRSSSSSTIIHVAIYLGNNQVIESWPNKVQIMHITSSSHPYVAGVVRPFQ